MLFKGPLPATVTKASAGGARQPGEKALSERKKQSDVTTRFHSIVKTSLSWPVFSILATGGFSGPTAGFAGCLLSTAA